jgi:hypothetical protein
MVYKGGLRCNLIDYPKLLPHNPIVNHPDHNPHLIRSEAEIPSILS